MSNRQLAVIGLDGVRLDVVRRFKDDLPFLSDLLSDGASGILRSVHPGPHSGPAWTSFSTGVNPGKHGLGDWRIRDGYDFVPASGEDIDQYRFWEYLSDAGVTVGVFNIPLTNPPTSVNGVLVNSWTSSLDEYAYPSPFQKQLDRLGYVQKADFTPDDVGPLLAAIETRREACELYLEQYDWNLLVGMFYETEQAHHKFASFLDPDHPEHDPTYEHKVRTVYKKIDEELAELSESLGDATLLLMSDHGFCPVYERIHLNRVLEDLGYYEPAPDSDSNSVLSPERLFASTVSNIYSLSPVQRLSRRFASIPPFDSVVNSIAKTYRSIEYKKRVRCDWERTVAFNGYEHGGIFINTTELPQGVVDDVEVEPLVEEIIADLETHEFLESRIEGVYRREELFEGDKRVSLPEIIVNFADGYIGSSGYDERYARGPDEISNIGFHTFEGLLVAAGEDIEPGVTSGANILDIAPTVLHYFDIPVPQNVDGEPLKQLFRDGSSFNERSVSVESPKYSDSAAKRITEAERDEIEARLRDIGYS